MWYVYIIECKNKTLYTGITTDITRRFAEHQKGIGSRYTRINPPIRIIHTETYSSRSQALKRERYIKKFSPAGKRALIHGD